MDDPEADEEGGAAEPGHHAPDSGCLETKVKVRRSPQMTMYFLEEISFLQIFKSRPLSN